MSRGVGLPGLFVVGTDTGVGKTAVAAAIAEAVASSGRRVGVLKPVATGARRDGDHWHCDDADRLIAAAGVRVPLSRVVPVLFEEPLAPPVAARRAGQSLELARVLETVQETVDWWSERADFLVIEGTGGFLCPLAEGSTVADLAVSLDYPLLVVARRGLGTLNHTLMTFEAVRLRALRVAGLVLNTPGSAEHGHAELTAAHELARRLPGVSVLAELPHVAGAELGERIRAVEWPGRFAAPRLAPPRAGRPSTSPEGDRHTLPPGVLEGSVERPEPRAPSVPAFTPAGSTSGDELGAILSQGRPDPVLGEFVEPLALHGGMPGLGFQPAGPADQSAGSVTDGLSPEVRTARASGPGAGVSHGSFDPITGLGLDRPTAETRPEGSSADALAGLRLETGPSPPRRDLHLPSSATAAHAGEEDEIGPPSRGASWSIVLLASYASAVTIGLCWVLWSGRGLRETSTDEPAMVDSRPDPGRRADRARRIVARPSLPSDRILTFGQSLRLGQIEVTPVRVTSGPVLLERTLFASATEDGGANALKLHLRLKNVSIDRVLPPLDEAFLRPREPGSPDTFIETSPGRPPIDPFPLAVESEWSIVGQDLHELGPGESVETIIVSAPEALAAMTPEMTWRLRLRTDVEHTEVLGVRFHASDVRPDPSDGPTP